MSKLAIGIDLGTTFSVVGVWKENRVQILPNERGYRTTPSYVSYKDGDVYVGNSAKDMASFNAENTVFSSKRLIGRKFSDSIVQNEMKQWPFKVVGGAEDKPLIQITHAGAPKTLCAEEVAALILGKMKHVADEALGAAVINAVITVPAYFTDTQRQCTKDAGEIAGLNVLRIINEPTAAAIAYGLGRCDAVAKHILVYDFGGGTFDVTLLKVDDGIFEVLATSGDTHLGGDDIDMRIVDFCVREFKAKNSGAKAPTPQALHRLRVACERAKRQLSSATQATIEVTSFVGNIDFMSVLTRAKFEQLIEDLLQSTLAPVAKVLTDSKVERTTVDEILLAGGSTRIPRVQALLSSYFGGKKLNMELNPDEAIAHGATVQAAILSGVQSDQLTDLCLMDVTPISLGIATHIEESDPLFAKAKARADSPSGFSRIVNRNSTIPLEKKKMFTNAEDNQTSITIRVFEGEEEFAEDNNLLGKFTLSGLPLKPKDTLKLEVSFSIDCNGILTVTAVEKESLIQGTVVLTNASGRLTVLELAQMKAVAEEMRRRQIANAPRNQARAAFENVLHRLQNVKESGLASLKPSDASTLTQTCAWGFSWYEANLSRATAQEFDAMRQKLEKETAAIQQCQPKPSGASFGDVDLDD